MEMEAGVEVMAAMESEVGWAGGDGVVVVARLVGLGGEGESGSQVMRVVHGSQGDREGGVILSRAGKGRLVGVRCLRDVQVFRDRGGVK